MAVYSGTSGNDSADFSSKGAPSAPATAHAMYGYAGDDILRGSNYTDYIIGGDGNDQLFGEGGTDTLIGYDGNDFANGGGGSDFIALGEGDDHLIGGQDTWGQSSDRLHGGIGDDRYYHEVGFGVDIINDDKSEAGNVGYGGGYDYLFMEYTDQELDWFKSGASLVITTSADTMDGIVNEGVIIEDYYLGGDNVIEVIVLNGVGYDLVASLNFAPTLAAGTGTTNEADSVSVDLAVLGDDVDFNNNGFNLNYSLFSGPAGGTASISGTSLIFDPGSDFEYLDAGESIDVTMIISATDIYGYSAFNYVTITVNGIENDKNINGDGTANTLMGGLGDDLLKGYGGDDLFEGGAGDDEIFGYNWGNAGDAVDIDTAIYNGNRADYLITAESYTNSARNDTTVSYTIRDFAVGGGFDGVNEGEDKLLDIDFVQFADMTVSLDDLIFDVSGTTASDNINGILSNEQIFGYSGNDEIKGNGGNDLLIGGEGNDKLYGNNWGSAGDPSDIDTAVYDGVLADYKLSAKNYTNSSRSEATIRYFIEDTALNGGSDGIDEGLDKLIDIDIVQFADKTLSISTNDDSAGADILVGTVTDEIMFGGADNDTFVFAVNMGEDIILDFQSGSGSDDVIEIQGMSGFDSFAEITAAATDNGTDTTITFDAANSITLLDTLVTQLHEDDFQFI